MRRLERVMRSGRTVECAFVGGLIVLGLAGCGRLDGGAEATSSSSNAPVSPPHPTFLYGRVTADNGDVYEGRLRWGRDQEATWEDYFNGYKDKNPWAAHIPAGVFPERRPMRIFGFEFGGDEASYSRPFMARFGDIARIEARGSDVRVTMKSGTVFDLDRMGASDLDDGLRVWDGQRGTVDLESWAGGVPPPPYRRIRAIELLPAPGAGGSHARVHGTVATSNGTFTGYIAWNREKCLGSDELEGRTPDGNVRVRLDSIRSIVRQSADASTARLRDGREVTLSVSRGAGEANRGIYVDVSRYGRLLIPWAVFERIDFSPGGESPSYGDFAPGRPLTGSVTTTDGRRLAGRIVYDLDESETTETLDAPAEGVNYMLPFRLVRSIVLAGSDGRGVAHARVTLHDGEQLTLDREGDLGTANAGILVFVDGSQRAEYIRWADVARIDLEAPPAMQPPAPIHAPNGAAWPVK